MKVRTALNTVTDAAEGTYEDTYDKIFLPSLEQEFITPQASGIEGDAWEYWKKAVERSTPTPWYKTFAEGGHPITYAINAKTSAQAVRLRSASRGGATLRGTCPRAAPSATTARRTAVASPRLASSAKASNNLRHPRMPERFQRRIKWQYQKGREVKAVSQSW